MNIYVIGLNHKSAEVNIRERIAFPGPKLEQGILGIGALPEVEELVILSTCNRVELYLSSEHEGPVAERIKDYLAVFHGMERKLLDGPLYVYEGLDAVRHIFRVAASLDSMVLGEPQILGQLKDAFDKALEMHSSGIILNKLMKKSISVAKRVRTETKIAENAVSISFAAVELAKKIFTNLNEKVCMLLGAGEMAELAARHLTNLGIREVLVANRTYERGCALAEEFTGRAVSFAEFKEELVHTDIVICSTGAPSYVLMKDEMEKIMKKRKHRAVFIIDISVPRNIDPTINDLDSVYLYDVDDLQGVVDSNMHERQKEALKGHDIIEEEVEVFNAWLHSLDAVPTIVSLRKMAEEIKNEELAKAMNKLGPLDERQRKAVECLAASLMNKLIHPPTAALKEDHEDRDMLIAVVKRLFGLNGKAG